MSTSRSKNSLKIALVCTGLGQAWRGYERFTRDLFDLVKDDVTVTLFKGGGKSNRNEKVLPHLSHQSKLFHFVKLPPNPLFYQMLSYASFLIPYAIINKYNVIHYSEPGLGNVLYHAKKKFNLSFQLLFSNGVGLPPEHCLRANHLHQLTEPYYHQALKAGIPEKKMTCIPYGFYAEKFMKQNHKTVLRQKHNLPLDKTIVLCVSAVNRAHKRIDYLIEEFSRLDHSFFLVVCGQIEDPTLLELANQIIPGRHKFLQLPFELVPEIYSTADLFVHTALEEGFCLAIVEAMAAKLPVIAHHSSHFRWLIGFPEWLTDMSNSGALSQKIQNVALHMNSLQPQLKTSQEQVIQRYDWNNLKTQYLEMYFNLLGPS